jgi:hypothetical protein
LRRHVFPHPVGARWLCDCDVPDLDLFPRRYAALREVRFGAGVELALVQWALWAIAGAVRRGMAPNPSRWARPLHRISRLLDALGNGRSAMFVEMRGYDAHGRSRVRKWNLLAERHEGVRIPAMAAVAIARMLARGDAVPWGAMPCIGLVSLEAYLEELRGLAISVQDAAA